MTCSAQDCLPFCKNRFRHSSAVAGKNTKRLLLCPSLDRGTSSNLFCMGRSQMSMGKKHTQSSRLIQFLFHSWRVQYAQFQIVSNINLCEVSVAACESVDLSINIRSAVTTMSDPPYRHRIPKEKEVHNSRQGFILTLRYQATGNHDLRKSNDPSCIVDVQSSKPRVWARIGG